MPRYSGEYLDISLTYVPKVRKGDVRAAALALLAEGPRNGYQIIQEIAERSQGIWRPSPGSVYPALQRLEDKGLVRAEEETGVAQARALTPRPYRYGRFRPLSPDRREL